MPVRSDGHRLDPDREKPAGGKNFNRFEADFLRTMTNFARLTDPAKINVQPDRLRIKRLSKPMTLSQALRQFKIPNDRHSEHAILNSLRLQDQLEGGTLIKIIGK